MANRELLTALAVALRALADVLEKYETTKYDARGYAIPREKWEDRVERLRAEQVVFMEQQNQKIAQQQPYADDKMLTTNEAAELVGLSGRTLESMRVKGGGPSFVKLGKNKGAVRYRVGALREWIAKQEHPHTTSYQYRDEILNEHKPPPKRRS